MEDNIYYVYEWIRLDTNEPFYVGMGHKNRWRDFQSRNKWFTNIVNKIPCVVNILEDNISRDVALDFECWYIHEYKYIIGYDLCNITDGGDACVLIGEKNAMYGRPWWDENTPQEKIDTWRINHKKGHEHFKGEGNPFYGKKHTQESKIKISKNHADVSGKNNPSANIYKIIKPNGDILYMCGNQIYNNPRKKNDKKGFLNISKDTFNKYIRPYGCVDVTKIKTKSVIEKLLPYNGWQFIKID